jgi:hypothetical protein
MTNIARHLRIAALSGLVALPVTAGVVGAQQAAQQPAPAAKHHSKLKGAIVGAAAGHAMGGHAVAGAAAGAMVQHHRNKKAKKATP